MTEFEAAELFDECMILAQKAKDMCRTEEGRLYWQEIQEKNPRLTGLLKEIVAIARKNGVRI